MMETEAVQSEGTQEVDLYEYGDQESPNDTAAPESSETEGPEPSDTPSDDSADTADGDTDLESEGQAVGTAEPSQQQAAPDEPWNPTQPFTYQSGGRTHELSGALLGADGVLYVPPEAVQEVSRLVSLGRHHETVHRQQIQSFQRQLSEAKESKSQAQVRAEATANFWAALEAKGPQALWDFLNEWKTNKPQLEAARLKAEAEHIRKEAERMRQGDPEEQQARETETRVNTIEGLIDQVRNNPQYKFLSDDQLKTFAKRLWRNQGQLFAQADRDYPEHGVQKGQLIYQTGYFDEELAEFASVAQAQAQNRQNVADARKFNQQRNAQGKRGPAVGQGSAQTGRSSGGNGKQKFKSKQDWQDSLYASVGIANPSPVDDE